MALLRKLICLLALLGLGAVEAAERDNRCVVLITIDGFPARMLEDPKTPVPRLRQLAAEGVIAKEMKVSNPSVTWPNHTTLVTGVRPARHSVLFNGVLVRDEKNGTVRIDPRKDKSELVAVPTIYDMLHEQGLRTAAINWPCTRSSKSLDDDFPDSPETLSHTTPGLRAELVAEKILTDDSDEAFRAMTGPGRDEVWTRAACHVIGKRRPNFLLIHLLNTDGIHHRYGPESPASYTALALADKYVGEILDELKKSGMAATVFVTSDHGFATANQLLQPNVLLRQAGLLQIDKSNQVTQARVQVVPEGGTGLIYFTNPRTRNEDRRKVTELLLKQEGVADLIGPERFAELGFPSPDKNRGMGDLVLVPKAGYAVGGGASGDDVVKPISGTINLGYHGYIAGDPRMNGIFIASGHGIRTGLKIDKIENVDVPATIMRLFGQSLPESDGKVLQEIFQN